MKPNPKFIRRLSWSLVTVAIVGGVAGLVAWQNTRPSTGAAFADQGREHIPVTDPLPKYNSNPPTSGPHYAQVPPYGIYDQPLSPGYQVHLLEHGGVIIHYKTEDPELIEALRTLARELYARNPRVVLMPSPEIDSLIAVSAWNYLDTMDALDAERIKNFFRARVNHGPEKVSSKVMQAPADTPAPLELFE